MIVWFPLLKLIVSLALLWLAWRPIEKHMKAYKARERLAFTDGTPIDPSDSYWPREPKTYLPLAIVFLVILASPFRLQSPGQLEQTVKTYDQSMAPPPMIEREARQKYTPDDNKPLIREILKEEVQ